MKILLVFIVFYVQSASAQDLTKPRTNSVPAVAPRATTSLGASKTKTTPAMTPETELHVLMEKDITGQGVELGVLKVKVADIQTTRETIDRPDINSLKSSRLYVGWALEV